MDYKDYQKMMMLTNGTTAYETLLAIVPSCIFAFVATSLASLFLHTSSTHFKHNSKYIQYLLEFVLIVLPITLNVTVYVLYATEILAFVIIISVSIIMFVLKLKTAPMYLQNATTKQIHSITNFRATTNLITAIAILAVDFQIFPRYFAKTETYGFSLMDVGVGLFVFSNGLVSPEVFGSKNVVTKTIKSTIPLFILGTARLIVTKQIDYHVPVSEYGVHWNFFITLALTKILTSFILNLVSTKYVLVYSVLLLLAHEVFLQIGFANFVFNNITRGNFITANREGLVSLLGYTGLYFASISYGAFIMRNVNNPKRTLKLIFCSAALTCATYLLQKQIFVSRSLANSAYCLWIMSIGSIMISLFSLSEVLGYYVFKSKGILYSPVPLVLDAINYNGLIFFLLANILTGLVNILINTLFCGTLLSLIIVTVYMFFNCTTVFIMYCNQIKIKL